MRIYGISGLGADERVFQRVNEYLGEPIHFVPWIDPQPKETLSHYAHRLAETIDTSEPYCLVGVSFGGMIATEMNKIINPEKTIIISSAATKDELPLYFRGAGRLNLVPYIPKSLIQVPRPLLDVVMSVKKQESKNLVRDIVKTTDKDFLKWAVQSILTWDNEEIPNNLRRIHGKADRVLPLKADADKIIEGGHLVIVDEPQEIAQVLEEELARPA
ncbi:MAG: alpha/beta hydrolase [Flavobacteriales bacterium]|nr:alpha/beta hydrolase [Flavobacteriales bacterium]NNK80944.1 alpha/beta hydrolase [Flavobacteriales bacterium]